MMKRLKTAKRLPVFFVCMFLAVLPAVAMVAITLNKQDMGIYAVTASVTQGHDYASPDEEFANKTLIVKCTGDLEDSKAIQVMKDGDIHIYQYETKKDTKAAYKRFMCDKSVQYVEPDIALVMSEAGEGDAMEQLPEELMSPPDYMTVSHTYQEMPVESEDIVVAVLDTGVDKNSVGNTERIIDSGLNYSNTGNPGSVHDDNGHGTQMASIILANTNVHVKVMPIKVLNADGMGSLLSVYSGIEYAINHGADVINLSMTSYKTFDSELIREVIGRAKGKGIPVVTAAGNNGVDISGHSPANVEDAIVVSAINTDDGLSSYSNYGEGIDFCSYGMARAYGLDGECMEVSGTSVACANVSASIASLKVFDNGYGFDGLYDTLKELALDLGEEGYDGCFGWGGLSTNSVTAKYEVEVCEQAEIFSCDWRGLTDEELDTIIESTTDVNLSCWLQRMEKEEQEELLSRDTRLSQSNRMVTTDQEMNIISDETYVYSDYLLNNNSRVDRIYYTSYKNFEGHFFLNAKVNESYFNTKTYKVRIDLKVVNKDAIASAPPDENGNITLSGQPEFTFTIKDISNNDFIKFATPSNVTVYALPWGQHYLAFWVIGCMFDFGSEKLPEHYCLSDVSDGTVNSDNTTRVEARIKNSNGEYQVLEGGEYNHTDGVNGIICEVLVGTNACGITDYGPNKIQHSTSTFTFDRCYSAVCVDPNGGTYEDTTDENFTYADSDRTYYYGQCGDKSYINTPTRDYYSFSHYERSTPSNSKFKLHGTVGENMGNGWYPFEHDGSFFNRKEAEDNRRYATVLTAQWNPNELKVVYDTNGGGSIASTSMKYGVGSYSLTDKKPAKDYYAFSGWTPDFSASAYDSSVERWTKLASSGTKYSAKYWAGSSLFNVVNDYKKGDKTVNLYAKYTPNVLTIQYCDKNGSVKSDQSMQYSASGDKVGLAAPTAEFKKGMEFVGWGISATSSGHYNSTDSMTAKDWAEALGTSLKDGNATVKLYPCYKALPVYTITLDDNGGSGGSKAVYERYSDGFYQEAACINVATKVKKPVREGYDFTGYFGAAPKADIPADGSLSGLKYTKYSKDVTLKAAWMEKSYSIIYHSNYGKGGSGELTEKDIKKYFETKVVKGNVLQGEVLVKKDYHFLGWSTDAKATTPEYRAGDRFATNANTDLYAVWEKNVLKADIGAEERDNPGRYHDPDLDDAQSDGCWYKDRVIVTATGFCNYAQIANIWLCEPMKADVMLGNFIYSGPDKEDSYKKEYGPVDMDGDETSDNAVRLMSKTIVRMADGNELSVASEVKEFYIDSEPPIVASGSFNQTYDAASDSYTVAVSIFDYQSGVAEAALQKLGDNGSWSDCRVIDLRSYNNGQGGGYTTENSQRARFTSLLVNYVDYSRRYRIACRDGVGHESYSKEFTLAPELKLDSLIRKADGTSAHVGEVLELLQYGSMYTWADVKVEGYAEQLLYVTPDCIHKFGGSHVKLEDKSELDALPLEEGIRENYKNRFERYNFYLINTENNKDGKAADTLAMECDESKLELDNTYDVKVYALRGEDCKKNTLKIRYLHKMTARRIMISQLWQKPIFD